MIFEEKICLPISFIFFFPLTVKNLENANDTDALDKCRYCDASFSRSRNAGRMHSCFSDDEAEIFDDEADVRGAILPPSEEESGYDVEDETDIDESVSDHFDEEDLDSSYSVPDNQLAFEVEIGGMVFDDDDIFPLPLATSTDIEGSDSDDEDERYIETGTEYDEESIVYSDSDDEIERYIDSTATEYDAESSADSSDARIRFEPIDRIPLRRIPLANITPRPNSSLQYDAEDEWESGDDETDSDQSE